MRRQRSGEGAHRAWQPGVSGVEVGLALVHRRVQDQLPAIANELTLAIGENIDQLVDVKLMVIKRFDPELANRVFLDIGGRELKFIQNFGFFFGFVLGIPVAVLTHFVTFWWLLPILGVVVGYVTNWVALWMIYEPAEPHRWGPVRIHGLFIRRQHDVAEVYARIVADEILTVSEFGTELLKGTQSDRTRALIERSMRPAIDRATDRCGPRCGSRWARGNMNRSANRSSQLIESGPALARLALGAGWRAARWG
ncbi:MAG: hypothetical protein ABI323_12050 [Solirubrobacteraceae bacterium]